MATLGSFIPLILILVLFYFLFIRPQNKQQKQLQEMRNNMKPGDEVITIGGFYGIVYAVDDKNVVLEMLPDFYKLMVAKTAISRVITEDESVVDKAAVQEEDTEAVEGEGVDAIEAVEEPGEGFNDTVEEAEVEVMEPEEGEKSDETH